MLNDKHSHESQQLMLGTDWSLDFTADSGFHNVLVFQLQHLQIRGEISRRVQQHKGFSLQQAQQSFLLTNRLNGIYSTSHQIPHSPLLMFCPSLLQTKLPLEVLVFFERRVWKELFHMGKKFAVMPKVPQ